MKSNKQIYHFEKKKFIKHDISFKNFINPLNKLIFYDNF